MKAEPIWRRVVRQLFNVPEPPSRPQPATTTALADRTAAVRQAFNDRTDRAVNALLETGDVDAFNGTMRQSLRRLYVQNAALSVDNVNQLTARDFRQLGAALDTQYRYLDRWSDQLREADLDSVNRDALLTRGRMYESSSLADAVKVNLTAAGLPDLPFYPKDGQSDCMMNCYCVWDITPVDGGYDCAWILDPRRENCPTCLARAGIITVSNPLRIRGGRIVNDAILTPAMFR